MGLLMSDSYLRGISLDEPDLSCFRVRLRRFIRGLLNTAPILFWLSVLVVLLGCLYSQNYAPFFFYVTSFSIGGFTAFILGARSGMSKLFLKIYIVIVSFCIIVSGIVFVSDIVRYGVPFIYGGSDDLFFYNILLREISNFNYGYKELTTSLGSFNSPAYIYLLCLIGKFELLFGDISSLSPRIFNAVILGLLALCTIRIGMISRFDRDSCLLSGFFVGLFPGMVLQSTHIYRDVFVAFVANICLLITMSIFLDRRWRKNWLLIPLGIVTIWISINILSEMRLFNFMLVLALIIFSSWVFCFIGSDGRRKVKEKIAWKRLVLLVICLVLCGLVFFKSEIESTAKKLQASVEGYRQIRSSFVTGAGLSTRVFETTGFKGFVYKTMYFLISPVPVPTMDPIELYRRIGTILWILGLPYLLISLKNSLHNVFFLNLSVWYLLFFVSIAMISFSTLHMMQGLPAGVLLMATSFVNYSGSRRKLLNFMMMIILCCGITYFMIRLILLF